MINFQNAGGDVGSGNRRHRLHAPVLLALIGMRPAEVCGLRWSAVDLDSGVLHIVNTRTLVRGEVEEKGPNPRRASAACRYRRW